MILGEKITEERKRCGLSQEELAEKLSVSRQAVSKWESAQSTPDLQRVIQLAELFGVSTDYLLKDTIASPVRSGDDCPAETTAALYRVSMEEANEFLSLRRLGSKQLSGAVALCILSPVLLIFLAGLSESGIWGITEGFALSAGMIWLFALIAVAVFVFISYGTKSSRFDHLQKENFETAYGVTGLVREKQAAYEHAYSTGIAMGVVICIVAVVPLIVAGAMKAPDSVCIALTALLLILVAVGTYLIVGVSTIKGSFDTLLQEGDYSRAEKRANKTLDTVSSAYWCLATAVYLGWSFWTESWKTTWIVWPVAGVLFAVVLAIAKLCVKTEKP